MTTDRLMALDLLVSVLTAAAWMSAGVAAAARRPRTAAALFAVALVASLARVWSVLALAGAGWWFVQEKITVALPLLVAAGAAATALAGPRLLRAARRADAASREAVKAPAVAVPLLGAGYAATAGIVQTFLIGYPADPGTALLLLAVAAGAVLGTWRAMSTHVPGLRTATAVTAVAAVLGGTLVFVPSGETTAEGSATGGTAAMAATGSGSGSGSHDHHLASEGSASLMGAETRPVTDLRGPAAPPPGGAVRRFELTARTATVTLSSGRKVPAWTFNGQVPGPPLTAVQGDLVEVRLRNADITSGVTLHWHGYDVPSGEDGVPGLTQEAVPPGGEFVYRFVAAQVGTYWYHTHEVSDLGVRMGLYGTLVVTPKGTAAEGLDLTLPVHTLGGVTVTGDRDQPLVRQAAPGTPVRLRLINTDNTPHRFTLAGTSYRLVAVDGTDLNGPGTLGRVGLRLAAGGRYDLAFTMPSDPVLLRVDDRTDSVRITPESGPPGDDGAATAGASAVPAVDSGAVPAAGGQTAGWPELDLTRYGAPAPTPFTSRSRFDRNFTLVLDRGFALVNGRPAYAHTVNGAAFPDIPTEVVREGDLVRLTVVNRGRETHPWHLHGHRVLVLSRDGRSVTGSPLWLDTFDVQPGQVWEVAFRAANPGLWMNHCHNLSHADLGMMLHLAYEGVTTPFHGAHSG
ncbi:multicopper oxidase family protein [Microbispora bryophytorum]|uniref:Multicopper oxidase family protein n=1 Tax=Microbispora bryophytorum subsp. camponoti TaxID=1677852 RepID=A0ABR8L6K1_9ACTN|nr:multicopper oxidase family protein [Microbispora camponoti]MBD3146541.1 multicopper oxidase family protein [Microbispora camponoti]